MNDPRLVRDVICGKPFFVEQPDRPTRFESLVIVLTILGLMAAAITQINQRHQHLREEMGAGARP